MIDYGLILLLSDWGQVLEDCGRVRHGHRGLLFVYNQLWAGIPDLAAYLQLLVVILHRFNFLSLGVGIAIRFNEMAEQEIELVGVLKLLDDPESQDLVLIIKQIQHLLSRYEPQTLKLGQDVFLLVVQAFDTLLLLHKAQNQV